MHVYSCLGLQECRTLSMPNEEKQHTKNCSLQEKSKCGRTTVHQEEVMNKCGLCSITCHSKKKKSHNATEVYIRNNSPFTNVNSSVCGQNTWLNLWFQYNTSGLYIPVLICLIHSTCPIIFGEEYIMKLLIMQFSPSSCSFILLDLNVLQYMFFPVCDRWIFTLIHNSR